MKTNFNTLNYNSPSFKSINIVKVPKKLFQNPNNLLECSKTFDKHITNASKDPIKGLLGGIIALLGGKNLAKTASCIEPPSYLMTKTEMEDVGLNYSMDWVRSNTGLPIKDACSNENFFNVLVLTGEDKNKYIDATNDTFTKIIKYTKEAAHKYSDPRLLQIFAIAKLGIEQDKALDKIIGENTINRFSIEKFEDLNKIVNLLGIK